MTQKNSTEKKEFYGQVIRVVFIQYVMHHRCFAQNCNRILVESTTDRTSRLAQQTTLLYAVFLSMKWDLL